MRPTIILLVLTLFSLSLFAQDGGNDTILKKSLGEVVISAARMKVPLNQIPASISVVTPRQLNTLNKSICADEVMRLVPGVRIENGTDGSRVHLYIRGQGVLTESGFRGIQVLIDGVSLNDPAGYCPDFYDVDWSTVKSVEIVKGLAASMYGASATGGVVNIITKDGGERPASATLYASGGSYGFWKLGGTVDGSSKNVDYRVSYGHAQGHGYREHQSFMADNFSEKLNWTPSNKIRISQIISYTNYFNQNSEGINLGRYDTVGPTAANTDAVPYNEFHLTQRLTAALLGKFNFKDNQDIQVKGFARLNNYRETSNNGDDYKPFTNFGFSGQYDVTLGNDKLRNYLGLGIDFATKNLNEHMFAVPDGAHINKERVDSYWSMDAFDMNNVLVNQIIKQRSTGLFLIDKFDIGSKLHATLNVRYDYIYNELVNNKWEIDSTADLSNGSRTFTKPTWRLGLVYELAKFLNIYANYGTGYLVPTEDELYNNPAHWGGFNESIDPSDSKGFELGFRGDAGSKFHYDLTGFLVNSDNEFVRFSIPGRGNNTAFYKNGGASRRYGVEAFASWMPVKNLNLEAAYTYSNCRFTSPDSVKNHWIPQCPEHVLTAEVSYFFLKHFTVALNAQVVSKWCIQYDDSIYDSYTENGIKRSSWVDGYKIFSADLNYNWKLGPIAGDLGLYVKNLFDEHYFGFTEPNNGPDYNSYQPAPGREWFLSLRVKF